jgi:hypothetical protein
MLPIPCGREPRYELGLSPELMKPIYDLAATADIQDCGPERTDLAFGFALTVVRNARARGEVRFPVGHASQGRRIPEQASGLQGEPAVRAKFIVLSGTTIFADIASA